MSHPDAEGDVGVQESLPLEFEAGFEEFRGFHRRGESGRRGRETALMDVYGIISGWEGGIESGKRMDASEEREEGRGINVDPEMYLVCYNYLVLNIASLLSNSKKRYCLSIDCHL